MKHSLPTLLLGLALLLPAAAQAGKLEASMDKTTLAVGEATRLVVDARGSSSGKPRLQQVPGLRIDFAQESQRTHVRQGRVTQLHTYVYIVTGTQVGRALLGPVRLTVDDQDLSSGTFTVEVVEGAGGRAAAGPGRTSRGTDTAAAVPQADGQPYAAASVDKQQPYVGEALLYRLEVGVPTTLRRRGHPQVQVSGWDALTDEPGLEGHWTDRQKSVDGQRYRIDEVAVPLFSTEAGVIKLEPSQVAVEIVQRGRRVVGLESNPLELTVRPLPSRGKPDDFQDVVGRFRMESELDKAELATGGSGVLTVRVEGFGSLRGARPRIELPEGLRAYDETPEVRAWATDSGLRTEALFRTAVVPLQPGNYTLPPFELAALDPTDGRYKVVRSQPIELLVTGEPVTDSAVSVRSATLSADRSEVEFLGGIRPLHDDGLLGDARLGLGSPLVLCLLLLPLLGFTGLASRATRERMAGTDSGRQRRRRKAARDSLRATQAAARSNDLAAGEAALRSYLTARLDRSGAALSPLESSSVLVAAGASQELAGRLGALLASLEEARYGGASDAGLAAQLGAWIEQAEKEWR